MATSHENEDSTTRYDKAFVEEVAERDSKDDTGVDTPKAKAPWWSYIWDYDPGRTKEERKFVQKLDIYLVTILSLGYFIKGLDQANMAAAFVTGMKTDLHMYGNELNLVDTTWTIGYVIGMIPSQIALTKIRPGLYIPICELIWTVLTCFLALAKTAKQVMGIRFLIGLSESVFYPAALLILGSWYKPSELGKRAGILYAVGSAAGMFIGYLQIAAYKNLNGVGGKHGWQWLFIINAIISFPIALAGFWLYPDYPHNTKAFYLNENDKRIAVKRMEEVGRAPYSRFDLGFLKRLFSSWHIYGLSVLYIIYSNNGSSNSVNPLSLWLLSRGWSVTKLNVMPSAQAAVQLVSSVVFAMASDYMRNRPVILSFASVLGLISSIILAIWKVPTGAIWFALFLNRASVPFGPLSLAWANEICSGNAEERAIIIGVMNALGYAFSAWVLVLTYPQTDAPDFHLGWRFSCAAFSVQILLVWVVNGFYRREKGRSFFGSPVKESA